MTRPDNMGADGSRGHTPGQWEARREWSSLCIVDEVGDYIADIHDRETFDENFEIEDEDASKAESEANARLIAAAPELLEALEAALDALKRASRQLSGDHKMVLGGKAWGGLIIDNAEAAIAKATPPAGEAK